MPRGRVLTRDLVLLLAGLFFLFCSSTMLVPVLPAVVAQHSGSGSAGLVTACFYFPAVATQLRMPEAMRRFDARALLGVGYLLLGAPCFAYAASTALAPVLVTTAVRGVGFGLTTVSSGTLIAQRAPPERRGTVIGYAGLASGIPPVFSPALGVALLHGPGADVAFVLAGALGLAGAGWTLPLERWPRPTRPRLHGLLRAAREQALAWPFAWFSLVSLTRGAALSFVSLWLLGSGLESAATYLLAFGTFAYLARWAGGRIVDRHGSRILRIPGSLASLVGLSLLALGDRSGATVLAAGVLFGAGYGLLQSAAQLDMLARGGSDGFAVATTAYNIAIDLGVGLGGALLGAAAALAGYGVAFWLLPAVMALVVALLLAEPAVRATPGASSPRLDARPDLDDVVAEDPE